MVFFFYTDHSGASLSSSFSLQHRARYFCIQILHLFVTYKCVHTNTARLKSDKSLPMFLLFVQFPGLWIPGCVLLKSPPQPSSAAPSRARTAACSPSGHLGADAYMTSAMNRRGRKVWNWIWDWTTFTCSPKRAHHFLYEIKLYFQTSAPKLFYLYSS